jgi:hypothetical protein
VRVEILWMNRPFPVERPDRHNCFRWRPSEFCALARAFVLRLIGDDAGVQFMPLSTSQTHAAASTVSIAVRRFEEFIGGHPYLIEVAAVATDRWRARIVRIPGVPTALMPFYGPTPGEATNRLRQWLTRAHEHASSGVRRV